MWETLRPEFIYLMRIGIAAICGFVIGLERALRLKEAGLRTHTIVAIGSCLMMLISKYGFYDSIEADASRVAAQVVSGIGFLGAGMIIYKREALHGLTTAAGIWATAGIGMCIGAGLYVLSIGTTLVMILIQFILHAQFKILNKRERLLVHLCFLSSEEHISQIKTIFGVEKFLKLKTTREGDVSVCTITLRSKVPLTDEQLAAIVREHDYIRSLEKVSEE